MDKLKQKFKDAFLAETEKIKPLLKEHGEKIIDHVTVNQIYGGMRGIKSMLWETSDLDSIEGIKFRNYSIPELQEKLPRINGATEPLPEGLFWLMMVGEIPTEADVLWLSMEWNSRSKVNPQVFSVINALSPDTHPMTQFSIAIMAMQKDSIFASRYDEGFSKNDYWDATYEDTMNLIACLPQVAAYIYRRSFHNNVHIPADPSLDWGANFAHMMGVDAPEFKDLMRLYMTIHADHEGGNASAHAVHLTGSTLSDAYLALSSGINALAGPLHGLANQECVKWINDMCSDLNTNNPSKQQIEEYVKTTLKEGKVVPGYGHAVLRRPDPRFIAQMDFAKRHAHHDDMVQIVWNVFEVVPPILESLGKIKNPWPNVDAHSGALLIHYGVTEFNFYTVMFGVSRSLGVLAQLCWSRAFNLPIERPKSLTTDWIREFVSKN